MNYGRESPVWTILRRVAIAKPKKKYRSWKRIFGPWPNQRASRIPSFSPPYRHIRQLVINLDNGPENSSFRTQFMKRMVEFADRNELEIVLVYYPPYHSKYNPIERCWGILEMHWNGTLLDTVDTVLQWARTMTWKAIQPAVHLLEKVYEKGVRVAKKAFKKIEDRLERNQSLPKYCVRIQPHGG